jgi:hypothetical protein
MQCLGRSRSTGAFVSLVAYPLCWLVATQRTTTKAAVAGGEQPPTLCLWRQAFNEVLINIGRSVHLIHQQPSNPLKLIEKAIGLGFMMN